MKKRILLILSVILCLTFTACGMYAVKVASDFSQFEMESVRFDVSEYPELVSVLEDEDAAVTFGKFNFNTTEMGFTARNSKGVITGFYAADLENGTIKKIEPMPFKTEHAVVGSFVYNDKLYCVTMDDELTMESGCSYLESNDGIVTLTENGLQEFDTRFFCENGYIVMRKKSQQMGMMHYRVYSVDKGDFIIDEDVKCTEIRENASYDILNWLDGDRYMHFNTTTGEIVDVTEQFHAVDDNHIHGETPQGKMLDYRYVWNKTFYEITEDKGIHIYSMNSAVPFVDHIDKLNYTLYQKPYLSEDGKTLVLNKFIMKERDR